MQVRRLLILILMMLILGVFTSSISQNVVELRRWQTMQDEYHSDDIVIRVSVTTDSLKYEIVWYSILATIQFVGIILLQIEFGRLDNEEAKKREDPKEMERENE